MALGQQSHDRQLHRFVFAADGLLDVFLERVDALPDPGHRIVGVGPGVQVLSRGERAHGRLGLLRRVG